MTIPHPIPYQGSKRSLASTIIGYFPEGAGRLVEPFAGSAAVSLAAAYAGKISKFLLNDINEPLIALWSSIVDRPETLADQYEKLWQLQQGRERIFYDLVRQRFNKTHRPYYLLYLLARCVKASVRYNANGEFNQSPDNRRQGRRPQAMRRDIQHASKLLYGKVSFSSLDYRQILQRLTSADIVYMDPPYQGVCANRDPRYIEGIQINNFVEMLDVLNKRQIAYIVSYDGRTGAKTFGEPLPEFLELKRIEINAGQSSQATLLGRKAETFESLYLSPSLVERLGLDEILAVDTMPRQLPLFGERA